MPLLEDGESSGKRPSLDYVNELDDSLVTGASADARGRGAVVSEIPVAASSPMGSSVSPNVPPRGINSGALVSEKPFVGEEMSQSAAAREIQKGGEGFVAIEEGWAGRTYETRVDSDDSDEYDPAPPPPPPPPPAAAYKSFDSNGHSGKTKKGSGAETGSTKLFTTKTIAVLAVLGLIVVAAIIIGALIGAGVIDFSSSTSPTSATGIPPPTTSSGPGPGKRPLPPTSSPTSSPTAMRQGLSEEKPVAPSSPAPTDRPTPSPTTSSPTPAPTKVVPDDRASSGADFAAAASVAGVEAVSTPGTPQYDALQWMVHDDPLQLTVLPPELAQSDMTSVGEDEFQQRFALSTLIFGLTEPDAEEEGEGAGGTEMGQTGGGIRRRRRHLQAASGLLPAGVSECELSTIKCNDDGKIVEIRFRKLGLRGEITPEIGLLSGSLKIVDLSDNEIRGTLPQSLYNLVKLEGLYFKNNRISGTISHDIGKLTQLYEIYGGKNQLTGEISVAFEEIRNIRNLSLYKNKLSGPLPDWRSLSNLFLLDLGYNDLSGVLPESLTNHRTLRNVYLDHNKFESTLPESYTSMGNRKLQQLYVNDNELFGEVPADWWNGENYQKHLLSLRLQNNKFSEKLDKKICELYVLSGNAELVELGADCNICSCKICDKDC